MQHETEAARVTSQTMTLPNVTSQDCLLTTNEPQTLPHMNWAKIGHVGMSDNQVMQTFSANTSGVQAVMLIAANQLKVEAAPLTHVGDNQVVSDNTVNVKQEDPVTMWQEQNLGLLGLVDNSAKPFKCDECGRSFMHQDTLIYHKREVHAPEMGDNEVSVKPEVEDAVMAENTPLEDDASVVPNTPQFFSCGDCGDRFLFRFSLVSHQRDRHGAETSYHCDACGVAFVDKFKFNGHRSSPACAAVHKQAQLLAQAQQPSVDGTPHVPVSDIGNKHMSWSDNGSKQVNVEQGVTAPKRKRGRPRVRDAPLPPAPPPGGGDVTRRRSRLLPKPPVFHYKLVRDKHVDVAPDVSGGNVPIAPMPPVLRYVLVDDNGRTVSHVGDNPGMVHQGARVDSTAATQTLANVNVNQVTPGVSGTLVGIGSNALTQISANVNQIPPYVSATRARSSLPAPTQTSVNVTNVTQNVSETRVANAFATTLTSASVNLNQGLSEIYKSLMAAGSSTTTQSSGNANQVKDISSTQAGTVSNAMTQISAILNQGVQNVPGTSVATDSQATTETSTSVNTPHVSGMLVGAASNAMTQISTNANPGLQNVSETHVAHASHTTTTPTAVDVVPMVVEPEASAIEAEDDETETHECDACSKAFTSGVRLIQHKVFGCRPFRCEACDVAFDQQFRLDRHRATRKCGRRRRERNRKLSLPRLGCDVCGAMYVKEVSLMQHKLRHHPDVRVGDNGVRMTTFRVSVKRKNVRNFGAPVRRVEQDSAEGTDSGTEEDMVHHVSDNEDDSDASSSETRVATASTSNPQSTAINYKCQICFKTFEIRRSFRRHMATHRAVMPFHCDDCDAGFCRKDSYTEHRNSLKCQRQRSRRGDALPVVKRFPCDECDKRYSHRTHLAQHKKKHHQASDNREKALDHVPVSDNQGTSLGDVRVGENQEESADLSDTPEKTADHLGVGDNQDKPAEHVGVGDNDASVNQRKGKKPFHCDECDMGFTRKDIYNDHRDSLRCQWRRREVPEKRHECDVCGGKYVSRSALWRHKAHHKLRGETAENHLRVGDNEEGVDTDAQSKPRRPLLAKPIEIVPFECEECGRMFSRHQDLIRHRNATHPSDFYCDDCDKFFTGKCQFCDHLERKFEAQITRESRESPRPVSLLAEPEVMSDDGDDDDLLAEVEAEVTSEDDDDDIDPLEDDTAEPLDCDMDFHQHVTCEATTSDATAPGGDTASQGHDDECDVNVTQRVTHDTVRSETPGGSIATPPFHCDECNKDFTEQIMFELHRNSVKCLLQRKRMKSRGTPSEGEDVSDNRKRAGRKSNVSNILKLAAATAQGVVDNKKRAADDVSDNTKRAAALEPQGVVFVMTPQREVRNGVHQMVLRCPVCHVEIQGQNEVGTHVRGHMTQSPAIWILGDPRAGANHGTSSPEQHVRVGDNAVITSSMAVNHGTPCPMQVKIKEETDEEFHSAVPAVRPTTSAVLTTPPLHHAIPPVLPANTAVLAGHPTISAVLASPPVHNAVLTALPVHSAVPAVYPTSSAILAAPPLQSAALTAPSVVTAPSMQGAILAAAPVHNAILAAPPLNSAVLTAHPVLRAVLTGPPAHSAVPAALPTATAVPAASPVCSAVPAAPPQNNAVLAEHPATIQDGGAVTEHVTGLIKIEPPPSPEADPPPGDVGRDVVGDNTEDEHVGDTRWQLDGTFDETPRRDRTGRKRQRATHVDNNSDVEGNNSDDNPVLGGKRGCDHVVGDKSEQHHVGEAIWQLDGTFDETPRQTISKRTGKRVPRDLCDNADFIDEDHVVGDNSADDHVCEAMWQLDGTVDDRGGENTTDGHTCNHLNSDHSGESQRCAVCERGFRFSQEGEVDHGVKVETGETGSGETGSGVTGSAETEEQFEDLLGVIKMELMTPEEVENNPPPGGDDVIHDDGAHSDVAHSDHAHSDTSPGNIHPSDTPRLRKRKRVSYALSDNSDEDDADWPVTNQSAREPSRKRGRPRNQHRCAWCRRGFVHKTDLVQHLWEHAVAMAKDGATPELAPPGGENENETEATDLEQENGDDDGDDNDGFFDATPVVHVTNTEPEVDPETPEQNGDDPANFFTSIRDDDFAKNYAMLTQMDIKTEMLADSVGEVVGEVLTDHTSGWNPVGNRVKKENDSEKERKKEEMKIYPCDVCGKRFAKGWSLKMHRVRHNTDKPFQCDECDKKFPHEAILRKHKRDKHKMETPEPAIKIATQAAPPRDWSKYFVKSADGASGHFVCDLCGRKFLRTDGLREHMRVHTGATPYKCDLCDDTFRLRSSLKVHKFKVHNWASHHCDVCGKMFYSSTHVNRHKAQHHGVGSFQCDECGSVFALEAALRNHKLRCHLPAKPFVCSACAIGFNTRDEYDQHVLIHNKDGGSGPGDIQVKLFECTECDKCFPLKADLNRHVLTHSDARPFQCETCGKGFKNETGLKTHRLIHMEVRPHQCDMCEKSFVRPKHLEEHRRIHTGEKPHQCEVCDAAFATSSSLARHLSVSACVCVCVCTCRFTPK